MSSTMNYKGYVGSVEFSEKDSLFFGKVMGLRAVLPYKGSTAAELVMGFHAAVDGYLALCAAEGKEPEKAYKGSFSVRVSPELHKRLVDRAAEQNMSLTSFVERILANAVPQ